MKNLIYRNLDKIISLFVIQALFVSCLCLFFILFPFYGYCGEGELILATGSKKGIYYPIGQGIADAAKQKNIKINILSTEGSVENLVLLSKGKAQLGIAQSDAIYNAYNGIGRFTEKISNIRAIASLYTEVVHILIRNPLLIKKIGDFKGKRISIGPEGSGTESNAIAILEAAGITPNEIQVLHLNLEDSIKAINESKVDIVFFTSGYPSDAVKIIMQNKSAYFFEPNEILQRLIEIYPFFIITTIPSGTYTNQDEDITTIGVTALLISRNDLDNNSVYNMAKLIFANSSLIANYNRKGSDINLKSALKGVAIPVHSAARQFYDEKGIYREELYWVIFDYALVVILILLFTLVIIKFKEIRFFFKKWELARVLAFIFSIWISGSLVLYYSEHKINENYSNLFLAFWSGLINWISFGGKEPYTFIGRVTATIMMALGVGSIALLTGQIASILVHRKLTGGRRKMEKIVDHYVIVNWNRKGFGVIEQIHNSVLKVKRPIIVISESPVALPEKEEYGDTYTIIGNPVNEAILKRANVQKAKSIIILADGTTADGEPSLKAHADRIADSKSIMSILSIKKICKESNASVPPIIAEILDPQKVGLAEQAGTLGNGDIKVVSSSALGMDLLAQAAINPEMVDIYMDLLTFSEEDSNQIYKWKVPEEIVNKEMTRNEFFKWVLDLRDDGIPITPIGLFRNGKVFINSKKSDINKLEKGDCFFCITYTEEYLMQMDNRAKKLREGKK